MKWRWLVGAVVFCTICANAVAQQASDPDSLPEIVAKVNGLEISKTELLRRVDALKAQIPPSEVPPDFYRRVLDELIGVLLLEALEDLDRGGLTVDALAAGLEAPHRLELFAQGEKNYDCECIY